MSNRTSNSSPIRQGLVRSHHEKQSITLKSPAVFDHSAGLWQHAWLVLANSCPLQIAIETTAQH